MCEVYNWQELGSYREGDWLGSLGESRMEGEGSSPHGRGASQGGLEGPLPEQAYLLKKGHGNKCGRHYRSRQPH